MPPTAMSSSSHILGLEIPFSTTKDLKFWLLLLLLFGETTNSKLGKSHIEQDEPRLPTAETEYS